jgi:alpha-mannosidase
VASIVDDLTDAEIVVHQDVPSEFERFEPRTVALLNRGVPGFAVDTEGTLHASLMRSCTGWPSGTWIDPPRRTAPDGSNFQLQHWTHTFDYALVSGDGDWRHTGVPARSAEFSHPLLAVPAHEIAAGRLPATGSLLEVESPGNVQLAALKAAGNPLAGGSGKPVLPGDAVAVRLVETSGATTEVAIRSPLGTVSQVRRADLLEAAREDTDNPRLTLHGYEIATVLARLELPNVLDGSDTVLAPEAELAQPLYARYWLHNRGPAPLGGLPAVAHVHPQHVRAEPDAQVPLRITVASDATDSQLRGVVRLVLPEGWSATAAELPFELPSGEHLETDVSVTMPPDTPRGLYPVRAQLTVTSSDDDLPAAWRQVVEDVCTVAVGKRSGEVLRLISGPDAVDVTAGGSARLAVTIGTDARADLSVEAHVISPWGTWEWISPAAVGAELPAGGTAELAFDVSPPPWIEPGEWWALVRVACAGRLIYSPAVKVTVR